MRHIFTSVDIGSDTIKVVTSELYRGRYNLLATSCVKSKGIKKGLIQDVHLAALSIKEAIKEVEAMLGFEIKKVISIVPSYYADFNLVTGEINIESGTVTGRDIIDLLQNAIKNSVMPSKEMVTVLPIEFILDDGVTREPLGKNSKIMKVRAIMASTPKKNIYSVVSLFESIGIEVVDISLGCIGDIYSIKDPNVGTSISAVINIGEEKTEVTFYNKAIPVKHSILNIGSQNIDNDIAYMYKIDNKLARSLKENFALAYKNTSSLNDVIEIKNKNGQTLKINQYEVSEIASSRIDEILTLAKQELNSLSNHKSNYIYVTGGITNMVNFDNIVNENLGKCAIINNVNLIGLRNNKFSSAMGNIIYFVNKLKLKGKDYSMVSSEDATVLSTPRKNTSNDTMLGKVFEYFFGE